MIQGLVGFAALGQQRAHSLCLRFLKTACRARGLEKARRSIGRAFLISQGDLRVNKPSCAKGPVCRFQSMTRDGEPPAQRGTARPC
jgi:hypothetical protein